MPLMTYQEAAEFAGCSISTLKRYQCVLCDQTALRQLTGGCGSIFGPKCDPKTAKTWPPKASASETNYPQESEK